MRSRKPYRTALKREDIGKFVKAYMVTGRFTEDFDSLECKERLDVMLKMLPYAVPKLRAIDTEADTQAGEPGVDEMLRRILVSPQART